MAEVPARWQGRILADWERRRRAVAGETLTAIEEAERAANLQLLRLSKKLGQVGVSLDAGDGEICARADEMGRASCAGVS